MCLPSLVGGGLVMCLPSLVGGGLGNVLAESCRWGSRYCACRVL